MRNKIGAQHLTIPLAEFCELLDIREKGSLEVSGHSGFIKNGFVARSEKKIYYGTLESDIIKELCFQRFDGADEEVSTLVTRFELLFVCWCQGDIATA